MTYRIGETREDHTAPAGEDPAFLQLPLLAEAGYFAGDITSIGVRVRGFETLYFGPNPAAAILRKGATGIEQCDNLDVTAFVRMLAKIGCAYIAGIMGLPPKEEVTVLPLILGQEDDGSRWVGSARFSSEADNAGALHTLSHTAFGRNDDPRHQVLVARVKLFAGSGAGGYEVIVHHSRPTRVA